MKERYGDPPESQPGYYQVEYYVTYAGSTMLMANNEDEAYERVEEILREEHPDAHMIETYDACYEGRDEDEEKLNAA